MVGTPDAKRSHLKALLGLFLVVCTNRTARAFISTSGMYQQPPKKAAAAALHGLFEGCDCSISVESR